MVNEVREKKGLNPLDVHVIDIVVEKDCEVVHGKQHEGDGKMSSTLERRKLLGTLLRPVVRREGWHSQPYWLRLIVKLGVEVTAVVF